MPNTYKQTFKKHLKLLNNAPSEARNAAGVQFIARVVPRVPVDTGRARANWNAGVGAPNTFVDEDRYDPGANKTPIRIKREIRPLAKTGKLFISNHLVYINRLEDGWSKQAPAGFMTITAFEIKLIANDILLAALGDQAAKARVPVI